MSGVVSARIPVQTFHVLIERLHVHLRSALPRNRVSDLNDFPARTYDMGSGRAKNSANEINLPARPCLGQHLLELIADRTQFDTAAHRVLFQRNTGDQSAGEAGFRIGQLEQCDKRFCGNQTDRLDHR